MITLSSYLILAALLFLIGVVGIFLNRKNIITLLMAIELMLLAVNINFIAFSHYLGDIAGQVFVFFILTVAAAESAIGLAIIILVFRNNQSINIDELDKLKGLYEVNTYIFYCPLCSFGCSFTRWFFWKKTT